MQSLAITWGVAIESMGVAKTSFCHYAMKILIKNTLKQEATSSDEELEDC